MFSPVNKLGRYFSALYYTILEFCFDFLAAIYLSHSACGSEVNISGVSADGSVLGEADLGRVYVGQKGVKRANDKFMRFNGRGEMWIPMYAGSRFTSGTFLFQNLNKS